MMGNLCRELRILFGLCALIAMLRAYAQVGAISLTVEVIDSKGQPATTVLQSSEVTLRLPLIAGSIFGVPNTGDILIEQVQVGKTIDLNVESMRKAGGRLASPVQPQVAHGGMQVEPRGVRFARFGTFVFDARTNRPVGGGAFVDRETRAALILMYFDEPCRISGVLRIGNLEAKHDISIRSSGLHWIRVREVTKAYYELDNISVPENVILGIEPPPPPKPGQGT